MRQVLRYVVPKYDEDRLSRRPSTNENVQGQRYLCKASFYVKTARSWSSDRRFRFRHLQRIPRDVVSPRAKFHADRLRIRLRPRPRKLPGVALRTVSKLTVPAISPSNGDETPNEYYGAIELAEGFRLI